MAQIYEYIFKCLSVNLTYYEKNNFKRLNYLFGENMRRGIFNPFNKGFQRNLEELVINMFDVDIYKEYKNYGYDMSLIYFFIIDESQNILLDEKEKILYPRENTTKWQLIKYKSYTLPKGNHILSIKSFVSLEIVLYSNNVFTRGDSSLDKISSPNHWLYGLFILKAI